MNTIHYPRGVTDQAIDDAFSSLLLGHSNGKPALLKPLLLLFMLGQYWHNAPRQILFRDLYDPFKALIVEFRGPKPHHEATMYPFWYLSKTSQLIWELDGVETVSKWYGAPHEKRPAVPDARSHSCELRGGVTEEVYRRIINDKVRLLEIVFVLLNNYFPIAAIHVPLLDAIGIPATREKRNLMNNSVLSNYNFSCSVCKFPSSGIDSNMNLLVAYLRAPSQGGALTSANCLAMCSQHKVLLDIGAFTLNQSGKIKVAEYFLSRGSPAYLLSYEKKLAKLPIRTANRPSPANIAWHNKNVFMAAT